MMVANLQTDFQDRNGHKKRNRAAAAAASKQYVTLRGALAGFVLIGLLFSALGVLTFVREQHRIYQDSALAQAVNVRLDAVELSLGRALNANWQQLNSLVKFLPDMTPEMRRMAFDLGIGDGSRAAWIGFASVDGTVMTASNGLLEGASVAERPWFRQGLEHEYAGDIHEAVLLNKLLNKPDASPLRFIDLAEPVLDEEGNVVGVLGMHINFAWVEKFMVESTAALKMNAYLVEPTGKVVLSTDGTQYDTLDLASINKAASGMGGSQFETWPDQRSYYTSVRPNITYGTLPAFGWRIVGRISPEEFSVADTNLLYSALKLLSMLALVLLVITVAFGRVFIDPITKLATSAKRIADGADEYPYEGHQSLEMSTLSTSLAVLQGRRDN